MFGFIYDKLQMKSCSYVSWPHATIKLHFSRLEADEIRKFIDFLNVRKCDMLCVNFQSVAVYDSAVMQFWTLPLEQRTKLFLII